LNHNHEKYSIDYVNSNNLLNHLSLLEEAQVTLQEISKICFEKAADNQQIISK
jgi:hypothetical protein